MQAHIIYIHNLNGKHRRNLQESSHNNIEENSKTIRITLMGHPGNHKIDIRQINKYIGCVPNSPKKTKVQMNKIVVWPKGIIYVIRNQFQ